MNGNFVGLRLAAALMAGRPFVARDRATRLAAQASVAIVGIPIGRLVSAICRAPNGRMTGSAPPRLM